MSREIDYDNLSPEDIRYLADRPWMIQPGSDATVTMSDDDVVEPEEEASETGDTEGDEEGTTEESGEGSGDDGGEPIIEEEVGDGYEGKTVAELKKELKKRKLTVGGNHGELVDRLRESDRAKG